jgi:hypothetical protein
MTEAEESVDVNKETKTMFPCLYQPRLKIFVDLLYQSSTIDSKALANVMMHENDGVFCEMSTVTTVTRKRLLALPCVCMKQSDRDFFIKISTNNRDIKLADMSQLYFVLGIYNFDRLCFLI